MSKRLADLKDYARYSSSSFDKDGKKLPNIDILNGSATDWKYIIEQFQFYPVAQTADAFVPVDVWNQAIESSGTKSIEFLAELGYSPYVILPRAPIFLSLGDYLKSQRGGDVRVLIFMPSGFVNYLLWKVEEACKQAGLDPADAERGRHQIRNGQRRPVDLPRPLRH
jgi:hypothetical protein